MLRNQLARIGEILTGYEELLRSETTAPSAFVVEPVVARAVDLLAHRVRPLAPRFTFENGGHHAGFGASGALVHAATNVLSNALDAVESSSEGAGHITVRVLASRAGGVAVRVSDDGIGIPDELRGRIFEPRFTTKPPGKGTGLGLHIARRLIGRFGGSVYLVDERDPDRLPWAVTEFCIEMPAPPQAAEVRP
jgi:signal transduction histidine kinase